MRPLLLGWQLLWKSVLTFLAFPPLSFAAGLDPSLQEKGVAPIVVPASQDWDGNDGPWSSFTLQVGTPAQDVKVLISTAATQTWVVVPEGCTPTDQSNCGVLRGGLFLLNQSTTWVSNTANISTNLYNLGLESALGYTGAGEYGFDKIALGWQGSGGPTLANQTVAGIATKEFYLGLFGLNPRPSNFTTFDDPIPSYLQNLRNQSLIPSMSWSYTAGNQYRLNRVLGSLTLGGYDASKFVPSNLSFAFNEADIRDLTVDIESITTTNSSTTISLLPTSVPAYIDSTVPNIWLPSDACTLFEKAFGLSYDNQTNLYLVNNSQHTALLSQNPNITFTLGNLTAGMTVNITLPYAAFDLTVSYPIVANATRYFPLKRALNSNQYTLGRTFLQEAYLVADYDRRNFSIFQCKWETNAQQDIVPIYPPINSLASSNMTSSSSPAASPSSLSPGTIVGIIICAIVAIIAALLSFYILILKPRFAPKNAVPVQKPVPVQEPDPFMKPELDAQESQKNIYETEGYEVNTVYEADGRGALHVEMEGQQIHTHELPAREEVAAEMGEREVAELDWRNVRRKRVPGEMLEPENADFFGKKAMEDYSGF